MTKLTLLQKYFFTPQTNDALDTSKGNTLVEILVSITVFSLFVVILISSTLSLSTVQIKSDNKTAAAQLGREALEIAYNLSLSDWESLSSLNGTYHPRLDSGHYTLSPGKETVNDHYTRSLHIAPAHRDSSGNITPSGTADPNTIKVTSRVEWQLVAETQILDLTTFLIDQQPFFQSSPIESGEHETQ